MVSFQPEEQILGERTEVRSEMIMAQIGAVLPLVAASVQCGVSSSVLSSLSLAPGMEASPSEGSFLF